MNTRNPREKVNDAPTSKHTPKRTAAQRAADSLFAEQHHLRGHTHGQIASRLSIDRGYTISRQQVAYDLKKLESSWIEEAKQSVALAKARTLKALTLLEAAAWDGWFGEARPTKSIGKLSRAGDPTFLKVLLEVHDRRAKLLGLDSPTCVEINEHTDQATDRYSDPPMSAAEKDALFARHYERILRQRQADKMSVKPDGPNGSALKIDAAAPIGNGQNDSEALG